MVILQNISEDTGNSSKTVDGVSSLPVFVVLERPQSRRKTDKAFLIVFAASIALLLPLLIYTLYYSDIGRYHAYDECGNICGQKNSKYDQWECTGQDMTLKPILHGDKCVEKGPYGDFYISQNRYIQEYFITLSKVVLVSFVASALCLILVLMFRYVPAVAVWSILIGFWLTLNAIGVGLLFILHLYDMVTIIIYSIISVLLLCICIIANMNNIRLATALLKEATKALFEVRMMSVVPIGALFSSTVTLLIFCFVRFHLLTYGKLTEVSPGFLRYVPDHFMPATMIFSFIMAIWAVLFVLGVQYITVAGAVAQWYTAKDLDSLNGSVLSNFRATMKYHLGTVALGSAMMTIMFVPRLILQFLAMFSALKRKADSWLRCLDGFFTTNSYIITAICGTSFIQSGKRARNLLKFSVGDTRDVNGFANFVIVFAQISIVFVSTLAMVTLLQLLPYNYYTFDWGHTFLLLELAIAYIYVDAILGTVKISINTLFFCATDELLRVKETNLPNSMTMKEFLYGSNKLFLQQVQHRPASNIKYQRRYTKVFLFVFIFINFMLFAVAYFI